MTKKEFNERDYDLNEIEEDPRFRVCFKEAMTVIAFWFILVGLLLATMYTMGAGDPKNYTYVCGLPLWFFLVCMIFLVFIGIGIYLSQKVFKNFSLEDEIVTSDKI